MDRLKQKVASSSSRVLASLQQVTSSSSSSGGSGGQEDSSGAGGVGGVGVNQTTPVYCPAAASHADQLQQHQQQQQPVPPSPQVVPEAAMSTAWLMAADATAHLTDEERGILLEVFKKEEQFQRDTIKQLTAARAQHAAAAAAAAAAASQSADLMPACTTGQAAGRASSCQAKEINQRPAAAMAPNKCRPKQQQQQQQQLQHSISHCSSNQSLSYPSATPTSSTTNSRPCSCTPIPLLHQQQQQPHHHANNHHHTNRTQSRMSTDSSSTTATMTIHHTQDNGVKSGESAGPVACNQQQQQREIGQCRICRKTIGTSEPCHLCSNCNQFICDDCASYSATEQHWMCSSCRRRAMNPAIPAEALKELGLNQNSSAVRRMTLRLNQSELKMAVERKSSNASGISADSMLTSSCSGSNLGQDRRASSTRIGSTVGATIGLAASTARNITTAVAVAGAAATAAGAHSSRETNNSGSGSGSGSGSSGAQSRTPIGRQHSQRSLDQATISPAVSASGGGTRAMGRLSSPVSSSNSPKGHAHASSSADQDQRPAAAHKKQQRQLSQQAGAGGGGSGRSPASCDGSPAADPGRRSYCEKRANKLVAQKTLSQPSPLVAVAAAGAASTSASASSGPNAQVGVRQSATRSASGSNYQMDQQQQQQQHQQWVVPEPVRATGQVYDHNQMQAAAEQQRRASVVAYSMQQADPNQQQQQQQQQQLQSQQQQQQFGLNYANNDNQAHQSGGGGGSVGQPQWSAAMSGGEPVTVVQPPASAGGSPLNSRRASRHSQQQLHPSEQIHMRRLSDQSNLFRRNSIIDDQRLDNTLIVRNRSHSNIDTVHQCSNYLYQAYDNYNNHYTDNALNQHQQQQHQQQQAHFQHQQHQYQQQAHHFGSNLMAQQQHQQQHQFRRQSDQQLHSSIQQQQQQSQQHNQQAELALNRNYLLASGAPHYNNSQVQSASTTNVLYLPQTDSGGGSSGQLTQRRLSDSGQYITASNSNQLQQQQQIASIITSYAKKQPTGSASQRRRYQSSEDLDDDDNDNDDVDDGDHDHDDPADDDSSSNSELDQHRHYHQAGPGALGGAQVQPYNNFNPQQQQPITIPSVSVSEFNNQAAAAAAAAAARRTSMSMSKQQQQQLDDQMIYAQDNKITPMQINVAIEQVIQQQQQHEQLQMGAAAAASNANCKLLDAQLLFLTARRGSSGRVLPRIPGDSNQSRSLFDLIHSMGDHQPSNHEHQQSRTLQIGGGGGAGGGGFNGNQLDSLSGRRLSASNGNNSQNGASAGAASKQQVHQNQLYSQPDGQQSAAAMTLGLPALSPTLRRASAPEGQNIKIVVDDMDHSGPFAGPGGPLLHHPYSHSANKFYATSGHEFFYERHILCRDDSLDPNGIHVGRGFGLQVMGGKLDSDNKLQACITWILAGGPADKVGLRAGDKIVEWDGKCLIGMSYEQVAEVIESSANVAELLVKPAPQRPNEPQQPPANYVRSQRRMSQQTERDLRRSIVGSGGGGGGGDAGNTNNGHQFDNNLMNGGSGSSSGNNNNNALAGAVKQHAGGGGGAGSGGVKHGQSSNQTNRPGRAGTGRKLPPIPGGGGGGGGGEVLASADGKQAINASGLTAAAANGPSFATVRHASTGQLDRRDSSSFGGGGAAFMGQHHIQHQRQQLNSSASSQLSGGGSGGASTAAAAALPLNSVHQQHLNVLFNQQGQPQQQSRSASDLYHGNVKAACPGPGHTNSSPSSSSYIQQQQQQQQPYVPNHTAPNGHSTGASSTGSWSMLNAPDQYGGGGGSNGNGNIHQTMPTTTTTGGGGGGGGGGSYIGQQHQLDQRCAAISVSQNQYLHHNNRHLNTNSGQVVDEIGELIGLQVNIDERSATLEISILAAHNIDRDPGLDYCVRIRILPESNRFKVCTTQPSSDMNWNETFLFQNFPTQNVQRMALEIGIWVYNEAPRLSTRLEQPICEALIPIQSARERNIDFWPLRPPPTSPQSRRKSLNDLIGTQGGQDPSQRNANIASGLGGGAGAALASAGHKQTNFNHSQIPWPANMAPESGKQSQRFDNFDRQTRTSPMGSSSRLSGGGGAQLGDSPTLANYYQRERSSSNRNLPDTNKLHVQPRRASDEVSTSSSHRLVARISPAASRRSISGMNVGEGFVGSRSPGSRLGSQASILKAAQMRRDSSQLQLQQQQQQQQHQQQQQQSVSNSPNKFSSCSPSGGSVSRVSDSSQSAATGYTPSGRRSSLVGIQSMTAYRSQKNSQSDATDHESPRNSSKRSREASIIAQQQQHQHQHQQRPVSNPTHSMESKQQKKQQQQRTASGQQANQQQRQISSGPTSARQSCSSNSGSRRGSTTEPASIQRRGSFALQTLRKLKRTMSLTKGSDNSEPGSTHDSRRSSSSSNQSSAEPSEDLAVTRPTKSSDVVVGRLKLSFIMTKGQFEVEVICARGLKLDQESIIGVYVKLYLKGRSKSNKRKTRIEQQQCESPVFRQTIRYDGSLVDNKLLEVSVWVKQGTLRGKIPVGVTEIRLGDLNLAQLQTSWYNLRTMDTLSSSSIDE